MVILAIFGQFRLPQNGRISQKLNVFLLLDMKFDRWESPVESLDMAIITKIFLILEFTSQNFLFLLSFLVIQNIAHFLYL